MKCFKFPWVRRAEKLRSERLEAEAKREEVEKDWEPLLRSKRAIDREIELNDWTATAVVFFSGERKKK